MACKYFLPFHRLPFQSVVDFDAQKSDAAPFVHAAFVVPGRRQEAKGQAPNCRITSEAGLLTHNVSHPKQMSPGGKGFVPELGLLRLIFLSLGFLT